MHHSHKTKSRLNLLAAAALAFSATTAVHVRADTVDATLAAQYFEVAHGVDADFSGNYPTVVTGSHLGLDGLPVGSGVSDLHTDGSGATEITWWSPAFDSNVIATGAGTISLPYDSNMYAPNSTGGDDSSDFETATFSGDFTLSAASTVSFDLGSDDDTFIYVDGVLIGQNPGIHPVSTVDFTSSTLNAGTHSIEVFYADRESSGAFLSLNLDAASSGIVITPPPVSGAPELSTWALMVAGIGTIGAALRVRRKHRSPVIA